MKREQRHSRNTKQNKRYSTKQKYNTSLCDDKMTFEDCELAILRHAVDETDILQKQKIANSDDVKQMIQILENFLIRKNSFVMEERRLITYCQNMRNFMTGILKCRIMTFSHRTL